MSLDVRTLALLLQGGAFLVLGIAGLRLPRWVALRRDVTARRAIAALGLIETAAIVVYAAHLGGPLGTTLGLLLGAAALVAAVLLARAIGGVRFEIDALLAEANERLEARVAERTASLRQANADLAHQIAARERIEAAWRESEADLAITLHSLGDAVISTNPRGLVTRINPAAEQLLGCTIDGALGRSLAEILHLADEKDGRPLDAELARRIGLDPDAAAGAATLPPEALLVTPGAARRAVAISTAPIFHRHADRERRLGTVLVLRDIGDQRRLEERLRLSDRLVSLGTMASGVAHEINNPLTCVTLNIDIVLKDLSLLQSEVAASSDAGAPTPPDLSARLAELSAPLTEAQDGAGRVRRIVRDLKLFSRSEDEGLGRTDVRRAVEAACNIAWNEVRHRARLVKHLADVMPVVANESRLGQVVVSLLINAAQAIPEGHAERNEVSVTTGTTAAGGTFIEVRDTGCGIPPENIPRLFDPFYTTKPVGSGTGLGLAVCHGIVRGLGGQIVVDSEVGVGSLFRVELPAAPPLPGESEPAAPAPLPAERRPRLLLVDDEVMILRTLRRSIGKDADMVALTRAEEALDLIRGGERFDLILCDLMMPTMTGMELFEQLCAHAPDQAERMVFVTGGAFTPAAREFLASVPNVQLAKPVDLVELKALIAARAGSPSPSPTASAAA